MCASNVFLAIYICPDGLNLHQNQKLTLMNTKSNKCFYMYNTWQYKLFYNNKELNTLDGLNRSSAMF